MIKQKLYKDYSWTYQKVVRDVGVEIIPKDTNEGNADISWVYYYVIA